MIYFLQKIYWKNISQIFFLLSIAQFSNGQVKFTAAANESKIGKNDLVQVQFKIENANSVKSINPPSFKNFTVVSGPNQETGSIISNGNRSFYAAISYILKPKKAGKFSIAPAFAVADGKEIKSNPLTITVLDQGTASSITPKKVPAPSPFSGFGFDYDEPPADYHNDDYILKAGEDVNEKIRKNLFVKLDANKTKCYVGEPIVVSFKLYTRLLSKTNITDAPSFNGFSVSEMDVNDNATEVKVNGKTFNCYTLRKVQLFPTQSGTFEISPLQSSNNVTFVKKERNEMQNSDPMMQMLQEFGGPGFSSGNLVEKHLSLASNSVTIHVKPLPKENVPENFKGAVGKFSIQSSLQKETFTTDDACNLSLKISGSGNLSLVNAPDIKWPQGIDVYDSKVKEHIDNQQVPISGNKVFNIPFTVSKAGTYSLPPIHFSWFNPESGHYDSTKTEPIAIRVSLGNRSMQDSKNSPVSILNRGFISISGLEWAGGIVVVGGLTALLLFVFFRRKNKESDLETQIRIDDLKNEQEEFIIPGNPLSEVHEKLVAEDAEGFYTELNQSLNRYLSGRLKIPVHELSKDRILESMDKCNVGIGTTKLFESLISEIELGLYAKNSHTGQMKHLYEKTAELVSLLNKQIC